jgi:glycosyltransferase involved in cell wall biosynthesis
MERGLMRVAFVIPAHNEERLVGRAVGACAAAGSASGAEFEIVVVCDACTDGTAEVARAGGARVVEVDKRVIAAVRNAGARDVIERFRAAGTGCRGGTATSRGTSENLLLFFVDADTAPRVESVLEAIEAVRGGAIGGGAVFEFDGLVPLGVRWTVWGMRAIIRTCNLTGGCFLFCTRAGFEAAGGFDETLLVSEEITMARSLKRHGRFVVVKTPVVTSGRKLRTYSTWEIVRLLVHGVLRPGMRKDRSKLDLWYGPRREDVG